MKILHLIYDHIHNPWIGGGGAVRAQELYGRLAERHDITLVCGKYPGARDSEERNLKVNFVGTEINNYFLSTIAYAFFAGRLLKEIHQNYDVIIEDFAPWNPLFSYRYQGKTTVMLQIQNYLGKEILRKYNIFGLPFYWTEKKYPVKFKKAIVVNRNLATRFGLSGANVLSNGIDSDLLGGNISADGDYVGYIGRIDVHQKGLDVLSEAIRDVHVKLKIAGDGKDRERFLGMLKDRRNAEWMGVVKKTEKSDFLSKASFIVVPSRFEGQGIVVLEAAACGKPVVVSDIPELRYAVEAGFGISFQTGNVKDLAEKIKIVNGNESLRLEMGRKAREYAKGYTWDKIAAEYESFLRDACDRNATTPPPAVGG
jgi:glycosyltransferase involved in cell wall biosynthesis